MDSTKSTEQNEDSKKEYKTQEHNNDNNKSQIKPKVVKNHGRSSEIREVPEQKKKETKMEYNNKAKKPSLEERTVASSISKEMASAIRTESRASSASSSPKRSEYVSRSKEPDNEGWQV